MTTATASSMRSVGYALVALSVGLGVQHLQQEVIWPDINPVGTACTSTYYDSMEQFAQKTKYEPYSPNVGLILFNPWVCISTQHMHEIRSDEEASLVVAGSILVVCRAVLQLLVTVVTVTEAGRQGNRGILLFPTVFGFLYFGFGMSIVFPALWVSSYCLFGGIVNHKSGVVNLVRARMGLGIWAGLPSIVLTALVLLLDTSTSGWNLYAGLLGSPLFTFLPLIGWTLQSPQSILSRHAIASAKAVAFTYGFAGSVSFLGWLYVLYLYIPNYGSELGHFCNDVWTGADSTIQYLAVDVLALWLAFTIHIASRNSLSAMESLLFLPFLGPGASCALELATMELERFSVPTNLNADANDKIPSKTITTSKATTKATAEAVVAAKIKGTQERLLSEKEELKAEHGQLIKLGKDEDALCVQNAIEDLDEFVKQSEEELAVLLNEGTGMATAAKTSNNIKKSKNN